MKFLSKVILVLRIYLEAGVGLGCAAPSFLVFNLCLFWVCMCKKVFLTMFGYLWLCMCLCVSMSQMSAEHLFLGLCQFLYLCRLLRVCVCIYAFVYLYLCVCVYVLCVCVLWISSCTCCLCVASVLPLFLFLLQSAAATNCSYRKLKSERMSSRCKTNLAFSYCTLGFWALCGVLMGNRSWSL